MSRTVPVTAEAAQVRELLETSPRTRLIDVRTPGEFASAHIPGSYNVPLDVLREHRTGLTAEHGDPIVLVCASGARADQARTLLETAGLDRLRVLSGGITGWEAGGGEVNRGKGAWAMERQVRLAAGLLVLTGVLGSTVYEPLKWLAGFVGGGLAFAALTNTCAMSRMLGLLPHNRTREYDPETMVAALTGSDTPAVRAAATH